MSEIKIKLDVFEGPLDLLLHLIKTLEIDIYDIPIAQVTDQYMGYIHAMKTLELELAGEYLVMAATLMAIKSQMLLPKQELEPEDEEIYEEDPRDALVNQLLEYRKYKYAAELLSEKAEERSQYFTKEPMDVDDFKEEDRSLPKNQITTVDLFLAFHKMLEKKKKRQIIETTISSDENSIEDRMDEIKRGIAHLSAHEGRSLTSFMESYSKTEIVTTFMAMLELMKNREIRVVQEDNYGEILLYGMKEGEYEQEQ
ncbi:segregation/condensation protein A [Enterococcus sp. 2201sp1_2201st1_B8_2201SCRN_220225]|uniref:segregation/condensation protein A n=1 Tax=unclassified Enterococcus TaxID=2608891 RepID=UPI0034A1B6A1